MSDTQKHELLGATTTTAGAPVATFVQPSPAMMQLAEQIVDCPSVIGAYASCDWDELHDDGKVWTAAIVREAVLHGTMQTFAISGEMLARINAFLSHMAERFRERTSRKVLGFRVHRLTRMRAMELALGTFDASLDIIGTAFGDPAYFWDRAMAHELVDDELQHWEA